MRLLKPISISLIFLLLTALTQIGGIIYLLSLLTHRFIDTRFTNPLLVNTLKLFSFLALYTLATFLIVPIMAKPFGRVPLPVTATSNLKPLNFITCLLNRHYVRVDLKQTTLQVASQMSNKYPGTVISYLDANFPFVDGFPLLPHLSHNDGKKLDLAFYYVDKASGKPTNDTPSPIGYGVSEEPKPTEQNVAYECAKKGYWQYSFLMKVIPQRRKQGFSFDSIRTRELINLFIKQPTISKIFLEPHLKTRLKLSSNKMRFHGCQAVRHDDHIHIQVK